MDPRTTRTRRTALPMIALSLTVHGAALAAASRVRPEPARAPVEIEVVLHERPAPPPPIPEAPRPAPAPAARRAELPAKASVEPPPALASAPPAPQPDAPRPLPRVGLSLGSTVAGGAFAVGVGNTLHGRASETAADPATVRPYAGGVPAARLSAQPRVVDLPRIEYPADARRAGVEGQVVLLLRIDARGAVTAVRVVDAPSPSLAEAARQGARNFRFTAALLDGEPVETEIRFTYTFLLE